MARKPAVDGGKRAEIAKAALELFLKNGYDGTSVRDYEPCGRRGRPVLLLFQR